MLNFIQKIKDAIFWRNKYCEECGSYQSVSNNSPCYFCLKEDLAAQMFVKEEEKTCCGYLWKYVDDH